ncbi:MAG: hypothetical protein A2521_05040, partial [Deltaproteobacteria bacterium RIFOXYD12_FULL_57_12]
LAILPHLTKTAFKEYRAELRARTLPPGHIHRGKTITSGSTGKPAHVEQTHLYWRMFAWLKQREFRWFRFDPNGRLAIIRYLGTPKRADTDPTTDTGMRCIDAWPSVGSCFATGPAFLHNVASPVEQQIEWLAGLDPDYLMTESGNLENLALGYQHCRPPGRLKGIEAIANLLTPVMRRRAEKTFGLPIHQNYGLNEIGIVACRCPEGGRYHVNSELCVTEVVDQEGRPAAPGQTGRLLVTGLTNYAMPLVRYDTDDLVEVVAGPCPCGRTLPSFGAITGRYRRIAQLPPGTYAYYLALVSALDHMPAALMRHLRQYQLHQYRDGRFELRLVTADPPPPTFMAFIDAAWQKATTPQSPTLHTIMVDRILPGPGNKVHNFTSDFADPPDDAAHPTTRPSVS